MSRFHKYSFNNTMLIHMQKPNATLVAGYNKWKNSFQRNVKKGERGIKIIAPTPYRKKIEAEKLDPQTRAPMLDANGQTIIEEKEVVVPFFRVTTVFDISQTEGKPLPQLAATPHGNVENYEAFLEAIERSSPVPVCYQAMSPDTDGFFRISEQSIFIRKDVGQSQTVAALLHEMTHATLHNHDDQTDRRTQEVQAESVAYTVCQYYGIETAENSFGYIAVWSQTKELSELKDSLMVINATASDFIDKIDRNYREVCRERGITLSGEEPVSLDTYPVPCPNLSSEDLQKSGMDPSGMLPVSKSMAQGLHDQDVPIYFSEHGIEVMAFETDDISSQPDDTVFAVTREDWENAQHFHDIVSQRINEQEKREAAFDKYPDNCYAIYQVKREDSIVKDLAYRPYDEVIKAGLYPGRSQYNLIYTQPSPEPVKLEQLYEIFNLDRPADFFGHSLSVSDIVAIKTDGKVSYHYCDSFGFKELPDFRKPENYLKNAELSVEDDCGMIDGIINNGPKELDRKPSVLEQLRSQQKQERKPTAPKKSAEREI